MQEIASRRRAKVVEIDDLSEVTVPGPAEVVALRREHKNGANLLASQARHERDERVGDFGELHEMIEIGGAFAPGTLLSILRRGAIEDCTGAKLAEESLAPPPRHSLRIIVAHASASRGSAVTDERPAQNAAQSVINRRRRSSRSPRW